MVLRAPIYTCGSGSCSYEVVVFLLMVMAKTKHNEDLRYVGSLPMVITGNRLKLRQCASCLSVCVPLSTYYECTNLQLAKALVRSTAQVRINMI